jgi:hypothetical protein
MKLVTKARASHLITLAAGLVLGFTAVGTAAAVSASPAAKTVTHHYSLAASAFAPDSLRDVTKDYFNGWNPTTLGDTPSSGRCFDAGLSLPPNAVLKSITFYYTEGASVMFGEINRQNLTNHTFKVPASFDSATTTGTPFYTHKTLSIPKAESLVNMTSFAYSIGVCPTGTTTFSGITITYTATS